MKNNPDTQARYRRDVLRRQPGRKAVQAGGILVPVKREVPRNPLRSCDRCPKATRTEPDADGLRLCKGCRGKAETAKRPLVRKPARRREWENGRVRRLLPGFVWVHCCRCGGKFQVRPDVVGPYLGQTCERVIGRRATFRRDPEGVPVSWPDHCTTGRQRMEAAIAAMYAAVLDAGGETEAKKQGLPTSVSDLQLDPNYDSPPEDPADDPEDPEEYPE